MQATRDGRRFMGDAGGIFGSIVNDATAAARAQVYAKLADFQALPLRLNRVTNQLTQYAGLTPTRGIDESAELSALQLDLSNANAYWNQANATVSNAIASISAGGVSAVGDVTAAIAAMTLAANQVATVEQGARDLIIGSQVLDDQTRQSLLALGAGAAFTLTQLVMVAAGAYLVVKLIRR